MSQSSRLQLNGILIKNLLKFYNQDLVSYNPVPGGLESSSCFVTTKKGQYVLRIYRKDRTLNKIKTELDFMTFLKKSHIPVPRIYKNVSQDFVSIYNNKNKSWYFILMELLPGKHLTATSYSLIPRMAQYQAKMHKESVKFRSDSNSNFKQKLKSIKSGIKKVNNTLLKNPLANQLNEIIENIITEINLNLGVIESLPSGWVHLDYDSENILVNKNTISGIIDFDDLSNMPFVCDLANSLSWWGYENRMKNYSKYIKKYLDSYQKIRKLTKTEISFIKLFMRLRNMEMGIIFDVGILGKINDPMLKSIIEFDKSLRSNR